MKSAQSMTELTWGAPSVSQDFIDQMAVHLHRYLDPWLAAPERPAKVHISLGFTRTDVETLSYTVGHHGAERLDIDWTMGALETHCALTPGETHDVTARPALSAPSPGQTRLAVWRLDDGPSRAGRAPDGPLGFVLMSATAAQTLNARAIDELRQRAAEAIRAGRRNSVRLTLESAAHSPGLSIKHELYAVLAHLPEWLGIDHSALLMVTQTVSDMVRLGEGALPPDHTPAYDVMAEQLFWDSEKAPARLVGMTIPVEGDGRPGSGLLECALRRQTEEPDRRYHRFMPTRRPRSADERALWVAIDAAGEHVRGLGVSLRDRAHEGRVILVPLISDASDDVAPELLGWLRLAWRHNATLPASTGTILGLIADTLATRLRSSSLYTLSARQLLLLEQLRDDLTTSLHDPDPPEDRRDAFIGRVIQRVATSTALPSLSIGQVRRRAAGRALWFAHPHGWTEDQDPMLPLDDPDASGVVGLAARLNRPIILAGGSDDETHKAWKNTTWVHEDQRLLLDERHQHTGDLTQLGWRRLSSYYKSAHEGTYATLAYPITFGDEVLGVIAVEVERTTTWLWWSGVGSQIFWRLLAAEIATSLKLLEHA